ncbi:MAG: ribonuclease H-like domain-containing protein, partial [Chloroflexi bacterium]|nr:ribonuclease H-like domain-containing protein [Chloroflexota bacterium]
MNALDGSRLGFVARPTPFGPAWQRVVSLPAPEPPPRLPTAWAEALGYTHPGPWAFVDVESTGRRITASTYAFLVGLLVWPAQGAPVLHQWLLPHPADEAALWHHLAEQWPRGAVLFTYNGARFDLPLLEARGQAVGLTTRPWAQTPHVDLLPWVRRAFRGAWPDHRLGTAVERLLGRARPASDVPAAALPDLYHHALLTGDVTPLAPAVVHNQADLEALAALWTALGRELARLP